MNRPTKIFVAGIYAFAALIILSHIASGCKTTTTVTNGQTNSVTSLDPAAAQAIKAVVTIGVPFAVGQDANAKPYLVLVANVFTAAAESGKYDPAAVGAALDAISIKELRTDLAKQVAIAAFNAYKGALAGLADEKLSAAQYGQFAKDLLASIGEGINAGLAIDPISLKSNPPDTTK